MTRINSDVDPKTLMDQHLMAEYRELPMVLASLRRSLKTQSEREILKKIPPRFTLNKGHVLFFYNKLTFLANRYARIVDELINRGYNLDQNRTLDLNNIPSTFFNNWTATPADNAVLEQRICEKIAMKPSWYKYYGKTLNS
jgi:deoxyribonuclease (pyrimidine dimer)